MIVKKKKPLYRRYQEPYRVSKELLLNSRKYSSSEWTVSCLQPTFKDLNLKVSPEERYGYP